MSVVVAYPWNVDDPLLGPVRDRFPALEIVAQPYLGRFGHHLPDRTDELGDAERAVWARAEATLALDLPKDIGELAPGLRWVQAIGAGIDHLDSVELPEGCVVTNAAGVAAAPIAEFAFGRLLAVWKRFDEIDEQQRARDWKPRFGTLVEGLTLGIIGLGAIGTEVAVRARAFGMTTIGTRRSYQPGQEHPAVDELRGTADLHDVLARCHAVVVSAPGTQETENLFDEAAFAAMKPGALFCNVGPRVARRRTGVDRRAAIGSPRWGDPRRHPAGAASRRRPLVGRSPDLDLAALVGGAGPLHGEAAATLRRQPRPVHPRRAAAERRRPRRRVLTAEPRR